jgi:hypothetical protein
VERVVEVFLGKKGGMFQRRREMVEMKVISLLSGFCWILY